MGGTHAVVLLDLKCVFELLLTRTALRTPPLQGHPGHPRPDQPRCQRQSRQGARGVKHHLCAEATAQNTKHKNIFISFTFLFWFKMLKQIIDLLDCCFWGKRNSSAGGKGDCASWMINSAETERGEYWKVKGEENVNMKRTLTSVLIWIECVWGCR